MKTTSGEIVRRALKTEHLVAYEMSKRRTKQICESDRLDVGMAEWVACIIAVMQMEGGSCLMIVTILSPFCYLLRFLHSLGRGVKRTQCLPICVLSKHSLNQVLNPTFPKFFFNTNGCF